MRILSSLLLSVLLFSAAAPIADACKTTRKKVTIEKIVKSKPKPPVIAPVVAPSRDPFKDHSDAALKSFQTNRDILTDKMKTMSMQPKGSLCFRTLAEIDADWVLQYNYYVDAYNDDFNRAAAQIIMRQVEERMIAINERIRLAPIFCY